MREFRHILFVSRGPEEDSGALKQALSLARNNQATLEALIVYPGFPPDLATYRVQYEAALVSHLHAAIDAARQAIGSSEADLPVRIHLEGGGSPATRIIQHVLRGAHDLVVKDAEPMAGGWGLRAPDMELLRKCPVPVWLSRPIARHREEIRVAVAVDPVSAEPAGHGLSLQLLRLARELADTCSGTLDLISCWDHEYEEYLRNNPWIKVADAELATSVEQARLAHRQALDALVAEAGIGERSRVHHVRGRPEQMIPPFIEEHGVDILVMGTVARTGVHNLLIGNTAESILRRLGCSLLALKPEGFVSPVKAAKE